ncbi:MAG: GNAT family N-acetyltransferase [Planctomycetes bacterium]|nr:GNAT family N-acetyltransferase [Planctomycetota bacterium]
MIEKMSPAGWQRVKEVRLRALLDTPDAFGRLHAEEVDRPPAIWQERLASSTAATFLAVLDGADVGMVSVADYEGKEGAAGVFGMWAAPEVRGTDVATDLIQAAIAWARDGGFARVLLDVADQNGRATAFYARMGFEPTGNRGSLPEPRTHVTEHERELKL